MNKQVRMMRVVVASPGDVPVERDHVNDVVEELNGGIARDRGLRLEVVRWETDTHPGFHPEGPQGLIDPLLRIDQSDVLIGIFWKRFGTPTHDAQSGTEHEFRTAYAAWQKHQRPQIMVYFCQMPYMPHTTAETEQQRQVLAFREQFPKEGLWWLYKDERDFERLLRQHLTHFLRNQNAPSAPPHSIDEPLPQDHRQTVIDEIASRLKDLSEGRLEGIAQAMVPLANRKATGVELTSNTETLAAQTASCMVDHIAVADVVNHLVGLLRHLNRQDANRVADVIDYLLPLNYAPEVIQNLSEQIDQAGFGLVENEVVTWTLAEIIIAGFDQQRALFKVLTDRRVRGQTAQDYDAGPVVGPKGKSYAVRDMLVHLLALLDAVPQRRDGTDIDREIEDYAKRLQGSLKGERTFYGGRSTYYVLKLPEEAPKRAFLKEIMSEVGRRVPQLLFVELAPYQKLSDEAEMDQYLRRIVRAIREREEPMS